MLAACGLNQVKNPGLVKKVTLKCINGKLKMIVCRSVRLLFRDNKFNSMLPNFALRANLKVMSKLCTLYIRMKPLSLFEPFLK